MKHYCLQPNRKSILRALDLKSCRELCPTFTCQNDGKSSSTPITDEDMSNFLVDNFYARAAEDSSAQYLSLMNAVFTEQKLGVLIDACIIPPTRMSHGTDDFLRQFSPIIQESSYFQNFQNFSFRSKNIMWHQRVGI